MLLNINDTASSILPKIITNFRKKYKIEENLDDVILKVVGQNSYLCKDYDYKTDKLIEYPIIRFKV